MDVNVPALSLVGQRRRRASRESIQPLTTGPRTPLPPGSAVGSQAAVAASVAGSQAPVGTGQQQQQQQQSQRATTTFQQLGTATEQPFVSAVRGGRPQYGGAAGDPAALRNLWVGSLVSLMHLRAQGYVSAEGFFDVSVRLADADQLLRPTAPAQDFFSWYRVGLVHCSVQSLCSPCSHTPHTPHTPNTVSFECYRPSSMRPQWPISVPTTRH